MKKQTKKEGKNRRPSHLRPRLCGQTNHRSCTSFCRCHSSHKRCLNEDRKFGKMFQKGREKEKEDIQWPPPIPPKWFCKNNSRNQEKKKEGRRKKKPTETAKRSYTGGTLWGPKANSVKSRSLEKKTVEERKERKKPWLRRREETKKNRKESPYLSGKSTNESILSRE